MKIKLITGEEINIFNYYLKDNFEVRNSGTSYLNEFKIVNNSIKVNSDFLYRLICYNNLRKILEGKYNTNLDIFGGVGITAKLFSIDDKLTYVNDIDENCLEILRKNFINVLNKDVNNFDYFNNFDLILADFNDFTISKFINNGYGDTLLNILNLSNKYVIVNDCSVFYLRYGKSSFKVYSKLLGEEVNTIEEFLYKEVEFLQRKLNGWKVINIEYFYNSSFLLLEKTDEDRDVILHKVESNKEKIIDITL